MLLAHDRIGRIERGAAAASVSSGFTSAAEATQRRASDTAGGIVETARQTAATASDTAAGAADALRGVAHDVRDKASHSVERMRRSAQTTTGAMRDGAASMRHAGGGRNKRYCGFRA
jgi:hypothetical protein